MAGSTQVVVPSYSQGSTGSNLDLTLIDESYGSNADLYEDVLRVATTATQDEIQLAYFDRRSELFTLLAKIDASARGPRSESALANAEQQRYLAERKMDSVVFAVRILADPVLRKAYNEIREDRTGIPSIYLGNTMTQPHYTSNSSIPSISPSNSAASESSTKSNNHGKKYDNDAQERTPRAVTPPETPPVLTNASSASESKNWIQSTFSSSIFGSISSSHSKNEDDPGHDEDRNPRKSRRRSKQNQVLSTSNQEREAEPEPYNETLGDKEKKSIWGRKKRKKKKQSKDEAAGMILDESMKTSTTDTSMTDNDESYRSRTRDMNNRPNMSMKSSASNNDYQGSPHEVVRRGDREDFETVGGDDDTRRDDDTRTFLGSETFADGETFATDFSEEFQGKASCGDDGMFGCISGSKAFQKIASEVSGACEDTLVSVDQVFHAFTLTDKDIKAVKKKIDKVKRQLDS